MSFLTTMSIQKEGVSRNGVKGLVVPLIAFLTSFILPVFVFAACDTSTQFCNPIQPNSIQEFLYMFIKSMVYILFPILVLMVIYTGFLFVSAQGNPGKISEARTALLWTIVGGLIILGAEALARAVESTVNSITN